MRCGSLVPDNNRPILPLHLALRISRQRNMIVHELKQIVRYFVLESKDPTSDKSVV